MCGLQPLTYLQVQVLPRQRMVGPSSDSRLRLGETPAGASSAVNGRARRRRQAAGGFCATTIAAIYRDRWEIELFFKTIKQHLKIKTFVGTSENAIRIQIRTALYID